MTGNVLKLAASAPEPPSPAASAPKGEDAACPPEPLAQAGPLILKRDFDARRINPIVNHPDVRPWVSVPGQGALDLSDLVADLRNVLLMTDAGGLLFVQVEPGTYEVHTQLLPAARGATAVDLARQALHHMFVKTDCLAVHTRVPAHNRGALGLVRSVRMAHEFDRAKAWPTDAGAVDLQFWTLRYWDWLWSAGGLIDEGRKFHARLEAAKTINSQLPVHADDPAHDRVVGAALLQCFAGQVEKGVVLYNHWARIAGYQQVQVPSLNPLVIDIGDAVIHLANDEIEVIACR